MFSLTIALTSERLDRIKAKLAHLLPHVKSSHRCEALARGLGYKTYAAALADAQGGNAALAPADGVKFCSYLANHGFDVPHQPFYLAVAHAAICAVASDIPKLGKHGIGNRPRQLGPKTWESDVEQSIRFAEERAFLFTDAVLEPFLLSLAFLARVTPTRTIRPDTSSYRLKHIAEAYACTYPEGGKLGPQYVMTGAFVAAAIHSGFPFWPTVDDQGHDTVVSTRFGMTRKSLDELNAEILPNSGRAQDRQRREAQRRGYPMGYATTP